MCILISLIQTGCRVKHTITWIHLDNNNVLWWNNEISFYRARNHWQNLCLPLQQVGLWSFSLTAAAASCWLFYLGGISCPHCLFSCYKVMPDFISLLSNYLHATYLLLLSLQMVLAFPGICRRLVANSRTLFCREDQTSCVKTEPLLRKRRILSTPPATKMCISVDVAYESWRPVI